MKKIFFVIMLLILIGFLGACRGHREVSTTETRQQASEIGTEFHDLQRFWNSVAERLNFKIEFYPSSVYQGDPASAYNGSTPTKPASCVPIDPNAAPVPPALPTASTGGGIGPVKSIEFSSERVAADSSFAKTDSTADYKSAEAMESQTEKASELRQDNGTWAIMAIAAAVAFIVGVLIVLKKFWKK